VAEQPVVTVKVRFENDQASLGQAVSEAEARLGQAQARVGGRGAGSSDMLAPGVIAAQQSLSLAQQRLSGLQAGGPAVASQMVANMAGVQSAATHQLFPNTAFDFRTQAAAVNFQSRAMLDAERERQGAGRDLRARAFAHARDFALGDKFSDAARATAAKDDSRMTSQFAAMEKAADQEVLNSKKEVAQAYRELAHFTSSQIKSAAAVERGQFNERLEGAGPNRQIGLLRERLAGIRPDLNTGELTPEDANERARLTARLTDAKRRGGLNTRLMSSGMYMQLMFGGWEAATAFNSLATFAATPYGSLLEQMQGRNEMLQQATGGPIGSLLAAPMNMMGRGPAQVNAALMGVSRTFAQESGMVARRGQLDETKDRAAAMNREADRLGMSGQFKRNVRAAIDEVSDLDDSFARRARDLARQRDLALDQGNNNKADELSGDLSMLRKEYDAARPAAERRRDAMVREEGRKMRLGVGGIARRVNSASLRRAGQFGLADESDFYAGLEDAMDEARERGGQWPDAQWALNKQLAAARGAEHASARMTAGANTLAVGAMMARDPETAAVLMSAEAKRKIRENQPDSITGDAQVAELDARSAYAQQQRGDARTMRRMGLANRNAVLGELAQAYGAQGSLHRAQAEIMGISGAAFENYEAVYRSDGLDFKSQRDALKAGVLGLQAFRADYLSGTRAESVNATRVNLSDAADAGVKGILESAKRQEDLLQQVVNKLDNLVAG
jgi:hypothetical protein